MKFSVIYTVDCCNSESLHHYLPSHRHLFTTTEGNEEYDYGYLGGDWAKGKHRKLCAILDKSQFERFLDDTGLMAEDCETMGSLGAPGFGVGWAPAISFTANWTTAAILNAYVTPIPDVQKAQFDERDWKRIRRAVINKYRNW